MNQKKARKLRQQVRKELGVGKSIETSSYEEIKHRISEMLKPDEQPRFLITNICTGFRGAYRKAKKGA